MPIPMVKCDKHGLCRAQVFYVCRNCASDTAVATPSASNNNRYMTALAIYGEYLVSDDRKLERSFADFIEKRLDAEEPHCT